MSGPGFFQANKHCQEIKHEAANSLEGLTAVFGSASAQLIDTSLPFSDSISSDSKGDAQPSIDLKSGS